MLASDLHALVIRYNEVYTLREGAAAKSGRESSEHTRWYQEGMRIERELSTEGFFVAWIPSLQEWGVSAAPREEKDKEQAEALHRSR